MPLKLQNKIEKKELTFSGFSCHLNKYRGTNSFVILDCLYPKTLFKGINIWLQFGFVLATPIWIVSQCFYLSIKKIQPPPQKKKKKQAKP